MTSLDQFNTALETGDYDTIKQYFNQIKDPNHLKSTKSMTLKYAHKLNHRHIIKSMMIDDITVLQGDDSVYLIDFIFSNDLDLIKTLIQNGLDVDMLVLNTSLLLCVVAYKKFEIAAELIKAGANIDTNDGYRTVLQFACAVGNIDGVKFSIKHGATIHKDKLYCQYVIDVVEARAQEWYPELTEYYPYKFEDQVEALIIAFNGILPLETIFEVCKQVATHYQ